MLRNICLTLLSATSVVGGPNALVRRQSGTSVVNLGNNTGTPQHLASGVLYGIPDTANQIPDHFYTDSGYSQVIYPSSTLLRKPRDTIHLLKIPRVP